MKFLITALRRGNMVLVGLLASVLLLGACVPVSQTDFPVGLDAQAELPENISIIRLSPENIKSYGHSKSVVQGGARLPSSADNWQYLVGVGDILSITVWDHPELTLPAGPERSQVESGSTVMADGMIFYPYIKEVRAAGRSVGAIQQELTQKLTEYIPDPQIEVKVAAFNSQKIVVTGEVVRPGTQKITNLPISLIEAVNGAGGLAPLADSRQVTVQRDGKSYHVDLWSFLSNGNARNNPVLRGGDIVNLPAQENNVAYILGQITQPGSVDLGLNGVNLTEAITLQGGLSEDTADAQGIFVFRNKARVAGFDVFQLDATTPLAFVLATGFTLHPQDVVYIVSDPAAKWNAVIATLVPTLGAIRGAQTIGNDL